MAIDENAFLAGVLHRKTEPGSSPPSLAEIGLNHFVPYLFNRIAAQWNLELSDDLRHVTLSTPQMRTLAVLSINSGLTMNELSGLTVTEQSTMSRTIDALEERGFVRRQQRADDMRVREVGITLEGRQAFDEFWPTMFRRYQQMFRDIGEEEYAQLVATLQRLLRNIRLGDSE